MSMKIILSSRNNSNKLFLDRNLWESVYQTHFCMLFFLHGGNRIIWVMTNKVSEFWKTKLVHDFKGVKKSYNSKLPNSSLTDLFKIFEENEDSAKSIFVYAWIP